MRLFVLLASVSLSVFAFNFEISNTTIANGATSLIEFEKEKNHKYEKITLGKKSFKVYPHPLNKNKMYALLPISYYNKPSEESLKISYKEQNSVKSKNISLTIKQGDYKKEKINVTKSKVNPKKKHS